MSRHFKLTSNSRLRGKIERYYCADRICLLITLILVAVVPIPASQVEVLPGSPVRKLHISVDHESADYIIANSTNFDKVTWLIPFERDFFFWLLTVGASLGS
ncbi:hypothetical protein CPB83DRAFT_646402 [Crepidotus variabilis]|uniref:Uncharacterized protein n=1 Tax=Crepidotus variabilis TaxID=179855 RepID=A0A9P6JK79_9AGAR|nr:hypothetical protein CPB83DRAFT_646402 [Crepidotus variabilis]